MTKVLITGASGFVGSHVLEASQVFPDIEWIAACRDQSRLPDKFTGVVRRGDLCDESYCREALHGIDVVVHAAAWTSLWGNRGKSDRLFYHPSLRFLETAVSSGVTRFVFVSTTSAAHPGDPVNPCRQGIQPDFWPHLSNVVQIENRMRELASDAITMVTLRCGLFAGERYNLGLLPILLPRLKTHLVPWINSGKTSMPIVAGKDLGQALVLAATVTDLSGYESFQIVGPEVPTVRQVIEFLHERFAFPEPHFSVPFPLGYAFAWLMEKLDPFVPWEPLVVRSIIHLLEETSPDNQVASQRLGYQPRVHWTTAIEAQLREMELRQKAPMKMAVSSK